MLIRHAPNLNPSEITPREIYLDRRRLLAGAAGLALSAMLPRTASATALSVAKSPLSTTSEPLTSREDITSYNNFYEFGTDKADPAANAGSLKTAPWTVKV